MPVFLNKLAIAYFQGNYAEVTADICKNQGTKSDDESWWVDKHTGYQIKHINFKIYIF